METNQYWMTARRSAKSNCRIRAQRENRTNVTASKFVIQPSSARSTNGAMRNSMELKASRPWRLPKPKTMG